MFESVAGTMHVLCQDHASSWLVPTSQETGSCSFNHLAMTVSRFEKNKRKISDPEKNGGPYFYPYSHSMITIHCP